MPSRLAEECAKVDCGASTCKVAWKCTNEDCGEQYFNEATVDAADFASWGGPFCGECGYKLRRAIDQLAAEEAAAEAAPTAAAAATVAEEDTLEDSQARH